MKVILVIFLVQSVSLAPISKDQSSNRNSVENTGKDVPGGKIYQGDMVFPEFEHEYYFGNLPAGAQSDALRDKDRHWPRSVPYVFDKTIDAEKKKKIQAGFDEYKKKTCIRFHKKTSSDTDYISFTKADGCWSYVGKQGGMQQVSIGDGCDHLSTVTHELMHALGFFHEQSRPDRDNYITVKTENIQSGAEGNFEKQNIETVTTLDHPYDYKSTMHYERLSFSKDGVSPTLVRKDGNTEEFGQGYQDITGFSDIDVKQLKAMYCKNEASTTQKPSTQHPSTQHPSTQHSSTQHPSTRHPSTQHPSTQKPATTHESTTEISTTPTEGSTTGAFTDSTDAATTSAATDGTTPATTTYWTDVATEFYYRDEPQGNGNDMGSVEKDIDKIEGLVKDIENAMKHSNK